MTHTLQLENITATLGRTSVLQNVSSSLTRGHLVALIGPNGVGKTSLLRAIAGLLPYQGKILLEGQPLESLSRVERAKRIGYLPQGHLAHWPLKVREIVALGRFALGATDPHHLAPSHQTAVDTAMQQAGVTVLAERRATELSGGERARVALARVLALGAGLILADEPTASLDPRYQLDVMGLLRQMADAGALVIAVTHDLGHAAHFADHIIVLDSGLKVTEGTPEDTLTSSLLADVFKVRAIAADRSERRLLVPWESLS